MGRPIPEFLAAFAEGRAGWRMQQRGTDGAWTASHIVRADRGVYAFVLTPSLTSPDLEMDWNVAVLFDAAVVAHYDGTFDEVTAEIADAERALALIVSLRQCRTRKAAWALIENVRGSRLELLRKALDLPRAHVGPLKSHIVDVTYGIQQRAGL